MDVLNHMRNCGMKFRKSTSKSYPGKPHNMNEQRRKIEALLADMKLEWAYADALAKHMFKIERVAWLLKSEHLSAVIAALSKEQEKRDLYQSVTESLEKLNMPEKEIDVFMKNEDLNWRRSIKHLKAINNHLNNQLMEV
jgi:phage gp16-like protein